MPEPPDDIVIRAMEPGDLPDFTEAWNQPRAYAGTLQLPYTSVEERQQRFAAKSAGQTNLVAVIGGKAIGMLFLRPRGSIPAQPCGVDRHGGARRPRRARRRDARCMAAILVDLADNWLNLKRLELTVYADNARAIALYERFGFEREGVHRAFAWRAGAYVDAIAMARLRL